MAYTVKQLADLAGVTRRTLHYYDQIGLLDPAEYGENGYRYYDEQDLLRGLGRMYERDPAFAEKFAALHPDLPAFLNRAIGLYCKNL